MEIYISIRVCMRVLKVSPQFRIHLFYISWCVKEPVYGDVHLLVRAIANKVLASCWLVAKNPQVVRLDKIEIKRVVSLGNLVDWTLLIILISRISRLDYN